jgi:hypothetical protein
MVSAVFFAVLGFLSPFGMLRLIRRLEPTGNRLFQFGASGLSALTILGSLCYFAGFISIKASVIVALLYSVWAFSELLREKGSMKTSFRFKFELSGPEKLLSFACVLLLLLPLVGVFSPSTALDWDSIAYHLAVPKLWIQQNKVSSISFIHHSNFPAGVDGLFILGETFGPSTLSKFYVWQYTFFGLLAILGITSHFAKEFRLNSPSLVGLVGGVTFVSIPMVMWETGSAYIDVANGLLTGVGFVLLCFGCHSIQRNTFILSGLFLGLAACTKYTGLQAIGIATITSLVFLPKAQKQLGLITIVVACCVCAPWYVKNILTVGNPVYPFFYSLFGGKNWDLFSSVIYTEEQKTFGYNGLQSFGQSILGLNLSPGRFTNPSPTTGSGFNFVGLGVVLIASGLMGGIIAKKNKFIVSVCFVTVLQLFVWIMLSQQSRYILTLTLPLIALGAFAISSHKTKHIVLAGVALQCITAIWIFKSSLLAERLPVVIGALSKEEFLGGFRVEGTAVPGKVPFYSSASQMNNDSEIQKIALFDEVFGYYLNKPYIWGNPGHTTELGYADMRTSTDFVTALKRMGVSHVYLNNQFILKTSDEALFDQVTGIDGTSKIQNSEIDRSQRMNDQRTKWRVLLNESISIGSLELKQRFSRSRFLFTVK